MQLGVTLQAVFLQLYYCYYYRGLYQLSLLQNFASVASVSQIFVSATLLVLAGGNYEMGFEGENYEMGFEGENLTQLCINIQI